MRNLSAIVGRFRHVLVRKKANANFLPAIPNAGQYLLRVGKLLIDLKIASQVQINQDQFVAGFAFLFQHLVAVPNGGIGVPERNHTGR